MCIDDCERLVQYINFWTVETRWKVGIPGTAPFYVRRHMVYIAFPERVSHIV